MKKILLFIFTMRILASLSAQTSSLYYSNNAGDSVAICGDTVFFRIYNDDAFASFDIGKGVFRQKRNGDLIMKKRIPLEWESSKWSETNQDFNNITIQAYYYDGQPAGFANIFLYLDGKEYMTSSLDKNGKFVFDKETSTFIDGKDVVVRIIIVGFETQHRLVIKNNTSYIIESIYPDYYSISHDKNIKITFNDDGSINILRNKNKRSAMSLKKNWRP